MAKISKWEADYSSKTHKEPCIDCKMFRQPAACTLVIGVIAQSGHCRYWEAKGKLPVAMQYK